MKQTNLKAFLLTLLLCTPVFSFAQWTNLGTAGFSAGTASYTSLAIDGSGTPYIAYQDGGNVNKATVMKYDGANWVAVGSPGFSAGAAYYTSMKIDAGGTPYIAYQDGGNSSKATVMKYDGANWVAVGGAGFSPAQANYISLAIDGSGTPYVAYLDYANSSKATVMKYDGANWVTVGTAGFSAGGANYISLVIDGSGTPHVAYQDGGNSGKATVMKYDGANWVTVGTAGFSASTTLFTCLALDGSDTLYIAYRDDANGNKATVMKYDGANWVTVGSAGFSDGSANEISLTFDGSNQPCVAYRDAGSTYQNKAVVMRYDGANWAAVGTPGFTPYFAQYTSLKYYSGLLYVGYRDYNVSSKTSVMTYSLVPPNTWNGSTWSNGTPTQTDEVIIASNTAPGSFTCGNLTINSGVALNTGSGDTATIYGDVTNNGNGVSGTGTLIFSKSGTAALSGNMIATEGTIEVASGCTLQTNDLLTLSSNATNTGRIGASAGTISGNVVAERYIPSRRAFRFVGHPFSSAIALEDIESDNIDITGTGGSTNGFTNNPNPLATNSPSAFWYDVSTGTGASAGTDPGWTAFTSTANSGANAWNQYEGIRVLVRGAKGEGLDGNPYTPSNITFDYAGAVNQGTQTINLTYSGTGTDPNGDYNLISNPYPSAVDLSATTRGSAVSASFSVWDATAATRGAYVTEPFSNSYILPSGAAFFVQTSAATNNSIVFEEADKSAATPEALYKTTSVYPGAVQLKITDVNGNFWDRMLLYFDGTAMSGRDQQDATKMGNIDLNFYSLAQGSDKLSIDVRPYVDGQIIPLGINTNKQQDFVISVADFDIPAGTSLMLKDNYTGTTTQLQQGVDYTFTINSDVNSQGDNRFELQLNGNPTDVTNIAASNMQIAVYPNPAKDMVRVSFEAAQKGNTTIKVMNLVGQTLVTKEAGNVQNGEVMISLNGLAQGMYLVEVNANGQTATQRIVKQ